MDSGRGRSRPASRWASQARRSSARGPHAGSARGHPALGGQFILQLMGTSIIGGAIAAEELTAIANNLVMQTFRSFEVYIVVAVIYFVAVQDGQPAARRHRPPGLVQVEQ